MSENDDKKIGFIFEKGKFCLRYPKFISEDSYPKKKWDILKSQILWYRLLKKYIKDDRSRKSIKLGDKFKNNSEYPNNNIQMILEISFELLEDYHENGLLLFNKCSTNLTPKGTINWAKTMKMNNQLISENNIIYKNFYFRNLKFNYEHPITILHAVVLNKVLKMFGIIHNNLPYDITILKSYTSPQIIKSIFLKYRRIMFSDRQKKIYRLLENYFSDSNIRNTIEGKKSSVSATNFNMIWEQMLRTVLNKQDITATLNLPKGKYKLTEPNSANRNVNFSGIDLRPDIIAKKGSNLLVLDAKNYVPDFYNKKGMPPTPDIVKQMFYYYIIKNTNVNQNKIINAFLLPYYFNDGTIVKKFGEHSIDNAYNKYKDISELFQISCCFINFQILRKAYLYPNKNSGENIIKHIIEEINK